MSARALLVLANLSILLPALLFAGVLLWRFADSERDALEDEARDTASEVAAVIDRELTALIGAAQVLSTSRAIDRGDYEEFHAQARQTLGFYGENVVLGEADGQQLVNTRVPYGQHLPISASFANDIKAVETRAPVVSDLFSGALAGSSIITVAVPVLRGGEPARLVVKMSVSPERFFDIIREQHLPEGWVLGLVDSEHRFIARSRLNERFAGTAAPAAFTRQVANRPSGTIQIVNPEGVPVYNAFQRLTRASWIVSVGVPATILQAPLDQHLAWLAAGGIGLGGIMLAGAFFFGGRLRQAIARLADLAAGVAGGRVLDPPRTAVREVNDVGATLAAASVALRERAHERDAAEMSLRESEARQRLILESATDYAIVTTDLEGRITSWSAGARKVFGWQPDEAVGHHIRLIFTPEDQAAGMAEAEMRGALADGWASDERWHMKKDGARFWAIGELQRMQPEGGPVIGYVKILRDRTRERAAEEAMQRLNETLEQNVLQRTAELTAANTRLIAEMKRREETEDQLRQLQKMEAVGQLTGGIAHDFNNMLAVVIGSLNLLQKRLARGESDVTRFIEAAIDGANRAATLTQRLLAFARQQPLAPEPVEANRLVAGMSELLRRTLGEDIRLETVLAGGLWRSHADPSQLENAVLNLAVNGRDAMSDGGRLTIETANCHLDEGYAAKHLGVPAGQYVLIAVSDTGSGMPADIAAKAFDPFFTTKTVGKGTGLGLSQVYGFVRQSGGHVKIYSEPKEGTTVKIYLPRFFGAAAPETSAARAAPGLPAGSPREIVLVVEDEERVRQFSVEALRELGYTVIHADSAAAALQQLDAHPDVSLLFTDIVMPDVNGRRLADEAMRRRPDLRVLFTTGYTRNAVVHNGVLDPGVNLITKPFTLEQLAAKVREVLGAPPDGE